MNSYEDPGEVLQESLKVNSVSSMSLADFLNGSEDEFVLLLETQGSGGNKDVSDICLLGSRV